MQHAQPAAALPLCMTLPPPKARPPNSLHVRRQRVDQVVREVRVQAGGLGLQHLERGAAGG